MKKYIFIICSSLILTVNCFSQILYTDIVPDFFAEIAVQPSTTDYSHNFYYDIDGDNANDFYIHYLHQQFGGGADVREYFGSVENCEFALIQYPYTTFPNIQINNSLNWNSSIMVQPMSWEWTEPLDKFFAIRKKINDEYYYGWIRLRSTYTLCDYAIKLVPNEPIWPGEGIPARAEYITAQDVNNNKNASDIQVSFDKAINEHQLASYRVFVVKSESAEDFNLTSANAISSASYFEITTGSLEYSFELPTELLDSDGDPVIEFVPYKIFVLSIANQVDIIENVLSFCSNEFTLFSYCQEVYDVQVQEHYQGGSIYHINLSFEIPEEENFISEYRAIFIKPEELLNGFNADSAMSLNETCYHSIVPTGNEISETLVSNTLKDYTGDFIEKRVNYKVVVLSVPDGVNTNTGVIKVSNQTINLSRIIDTVYGVFADDWSFSETASDVRITFNGLGANSGLAEYRVYACIPDDVSHFTNEEAESLDAQKYYSFLSTDSLISVILPHDFKDINGNPILNEMPYRFFIQAIADSITKDVNSLSPKSNLLAIANPNYFVTGQRVGTNINYYDFNPDVGINSPGYSQPLIYPVDINNDAVVDFEFHNYHSQSPGHTYYLSEVSPLNGNEIAVIYDNLADTMQASMMLNQFLNWQDTICLLNERFYSGYSYENGLWLGNCNYYLGVRIYDQQDTIYGWIDVKVNQCAWNSPTVTLKEFAYCNINSFIEPNKGSFDCLDVYPNPASRFINIRMKDNFTNGEKLVYLRDLSGKIVKVESFSKDHCNLGLEGVESGIYILEIYNCNFAERKKIVISK